MRDAQSYQAARAIATKDIVSEKQNGIFEWKTRDDIPARLAQLLSLKIGIFLELAAHVGNAAPGKMQRNAIELANGVRSGIDGIVHEAVAEADTPAIIKPHVIVVIRPQPRTLMARIDSHLTEAIGRETLCVRQLHDRGDFARELGRDDLVSVEVQDPIVLRTVLGEALLRAIAHPGILKCARAKPFRLGDGVVFRA